MGDTALSETKLSIPKDSSTHVEFPTWLPAMVELDKYSILDLGSTDYIDIEE